MTAQSGKPNLESGTKIAQCADHAVVHSAFRFRSSAFPRGITLVELLITMTIMAIIAAAIMGTASAAMESSRRSRTRGTINKIHGLIMERLELYSTRRVDVQPQLTNVVNTWVAAASDPADRSQRLLQRGQIIADARLLALRELLKYELPDRWSDVVDRVQNLPASPVFLLSPPPLAQSYAARWNQLTANNNGVDPSKSFEGPECLYLTVMNATGDGEARTLFTKQEIGDVDGDGAPEFLDGWGQPIGWLRWPAGFVPHSQLMTGDANTDHDPLDMYRRDQLKQTAAPPYNGFSSLQQQCLRRLHDPNPAFRLVPLIYSVGPDGTSDYSTIGLNKQSDCVKDLLLDPYALENPNQPFDINTNHFVIGTAGDPPVGGDGEDNSKDNIHNHLLEK